MRNINVTINTRNTFVRESLVAMVNDLSRDEMRARFSWRNNDLSDEDIIICEVIPGEIYLCNTLIKNRKKRQLPDYPPQLRPAAGRRFHD